MTTLARLFPLLAVLATLSCAEPISAPAPAALSVAELLGSGDSAGYERADRHRNFRFPEDHGPHAGFLTEWWYFTGNLADPSGRHFGYQLTFFRAALTPVPEPRRSGWAADHALMAHFTVTDVDESSFSFRERFGREALGLAGATAPPLRVWLEDWVAEDAGEGRLRLTAEEEGTSISLILEPGKPPVLQGDAGLSQKGRNPGNASYYYSQTRMPTSGSIGLGDRVFEVTGESWMDREWSTSALEDGQVGWDWFSVQLADGRDLMLYMLRREDGSADPLSTGTVVDADGSYRRLGVESWQLEEIDWWTSPASGVRYPAAWRVSVGTERFELEIRPVVANQELDGAVRYWEGAVQVTGRSGGQKVTGHGYVELTGYH